MDDVIRPNKQSLNHKNINEVNSLNNPQNVCRNKTKKTLRFTINFPFSNLFTFS